MSQPQEFKTRAHEISERARKQIIPRPAVCCRADDDAEAILRVMNEQNLDMIPVVDAENRLVGIFERPERES